MVADCCYTLSITITRLIPFITVPTEHYLSTIWHYPAVGLQQRVVHSAEGATGVCRCAPTLYRAELCSRISRVQPSRPAAGIRHTHGNGVVSNR